MGKHVNWSLLLLLLSHVVQLVAIKSMNDPSNESHVIDFLAEIKIMSNITPQINLVNMIGSCTSEYAEHGELWLLLEFCQHGDLKNYLTMSHI